MFVDRAQIEVQGGDGGNGIISFRREKYVPAGGPNGGDGGNGGDVILVVDEGMHTLLDFRYNRHYKGDRGEHGSGGLKHGRSAEHLEVRIPPGTVVRDVESGEVLADLTTHGQRFIAAHGGRGGRGNTRFAHARLKAPGFAEAGEKGELRQIQLELKLLADVGLVGSPNAGKSTLISAVSAAKPKIAAYPFTTLAPNLGVVRAASGETFVLADIPGLISGAHEGIGLGHEFLRHIERCRLLVYLVDGSGLEGRDPREDLAMIREEVRLYDPQLAKRPSVFVVNKMDLAETRENYSKIVEDLPGEVVFGISAATGEGLKPLLDWLGERLAQIRSEEPTPEVEAASVVVRPVQYDPYRFEIQSTEEGWIVQGKAVEALTSRFDLHNYDAQRYIHNKLKGWGVLDRLRDAGAKDGDQVIIGRLELEFASEGDFEEDWE